MSHSGVVTSIFCTSKEVTSYICLPPSVPRVDLGGIGSEMEVTGIVLLGVTVGLPVICSGCLRCEVSSIGNVVDGTTVLLDVTVFCLSSDGTVIIIIIIIIIYLHSAYMDMGNTYRNIV